MDVRLQHLQVASPGRSHASPFRSFWMGGFKGADHINDTGRALDMMASTGHWLRLDSDYEDAAALGFGTLRESLGWRLSEPAPGRFDPHRLRRCLRAADRVQLVWTSMHYGLPPDLSLHDDRMIDRFARFARAVAAEMADVDAVTAVCNPINEIWFLAWMADSI